MTIAENEEYNKLSLDEKDEYDFKDRKSVV